MSQSLGTRLCFLPVFSIEFELTWHREGEMWERFFCEFPPWATCKLENQASWSSCRAYSASLRTGVVRGMHLCLRRNAQEPGGHCCKSWTPQVPASPGQGRKASQIQGRQSVGLCSTFVSYLSPYWSNGACPPWEHIKPLIHELSCQYFLEHLPRPIIITKC